MLEQTQYQDETPLLKKITVGEGVGLRPLVVEDSERIFEILEADGDIRSHVGLFADCDTLEKLKVKLSDQIAHNALRYAITLNDALIGYVGLHQDPDGDTCVQYNVSYFLSSQNRGKGIVGDALRALLIEAEKHLAIDRFSAWVEEDNISSANVLKRIGFAHTGIPHVDSHGRTNWDYVREVKK